MAQYSALVTLVSPTQVPRVIERDVDDDQVIAAAVAASRSAAMAVFDLLCVYNVDTQQ